MARFDHAHLEIKPYGQYRRRRRLEAIPPERVIMQRSRQAAQLRRYPSKASALRPVTVGTGNDDVWLVKQRLCETANCPRRGIHHP
jgi:hypothetical protein